jgi:hypothetical protein
MTGPGLLIRPMTPADRPALANFPNRVILLAGPGGGMTSWLP